MAFSKGSRPWNEFPKQEGLELCREAAAAKGGEFVSSDDDWVGASAKYRWKCGVAGHPEFDATFQSVIRRGTWCYDCSRQLRTGRYSAVPEQTWCTRAHTAAAFFDGGSFLGERWEGARQVYPWKCSVPSHPVFRKSFENVVNSGTWCPECASSSRERTVRQVFDDLFGGPSARSVAAGSPSLFEKARPSWLRAPSGRKMELDGYSASLQLAFEYHGEHHYEVVQRWRIGVEELEAQQAKDRTRRVQCAAEGVTLVEVPHFIPKEELAFFVVGELRGADRVDLLSRVEDVARARGHEWSLDTHFSQLNGPHGHVVVEYVAGMDSERFLAKARASAAARGGAFCGNGWRGALAVYQWRCASGHTWDGVYNSVVNSGRWCPVCSTRARRSTAADNCLDKAKEVAAGHNGALLSSEWTGTRGRYSWKCADPAHATFSAAYADVVHRGTWCARCSAKRAGAARSIEASEAFDLAEAMRRYTQQHESLQEIGASMGLSSTTIRTRLLQTGVLLRRQGRRAQARRGSLDFAEAVRRYTEAFESLEQVATAIGVSTYAVRSRLLRAGIPLRGKGRRRKAAGLSAAGVVPGVEHASRARPALPAQQQLF